MAWSLEHAPLLRQCINIIRSPGWEVKITHCYRDAKQMADKLTSMGVECESRCNIYNPPREVRVLLIMYGLFGLG